MRTQASSMKRQSQPQSRPLKTASHPAGDDNADDSSSSDDDDFAPLYLIGTPIDIEEQRFKQRQATRAALHSTVDTGTGFTPASFVSSRANRANIQTAKQTTDYMDTEDTQTHMKTALSVSADIQGGGVSTSSSNADPMMNMIVPKHESVALRIMRQMGWREGRGIGTRSKQTDRKKRKAPNKQTKKVYTVALPPSLQAMQQEAEEEEDNEHTDDDDDDEEQAERDGEADADTDPDTSAGLSGFSALSLPEDVPLYLAKPKNDRYGLGFDPFTQAEEFQQHQQQKQHQHQQFVSNNSSSTQPSRHQVERTHVLDADRDEDVETWGASATKSRKPLTRPMGVAAGVRLRQGQADHEDDDEEVDIYEDRTEYEREVGKKKKQQLTKEEREALQKHTDEMQASLHQPLTFIRAAPLPPTALLYPPPAVPPGFTGDYTPPREEDHDRDALLSKLKPVVREYMERKREEERETYRQALQSDKVTSAASSNRLSLPMPPPPPPHQPVADSPPVSSSTAAVTAAAGMASLTAPFFSRFELASSSSTSSSSTDSLPSTASPSAPVMIPSKRLLFDAGTSYAIAAQMGLFGAQTREILTWQPDRLLCKRLGLPPPKQQHNSDNSVQNERKNIEKTFAKSASSYMHVANSMQNDFEMAAPPAADVVPDSLPLPLFKAIFEDDAPDHQPLKSPEIEHSTKKETYAPLRPEQQQQPPPAPAAPAATAAVMDALKLLSSIHPPSVPPPSSVQPPTPDTSKQEHLASQSTITGSFIHASRRSMVPGSTAAAPVLSSRTSFVHPSRQHLVPASATTASTLTSPASTAVHAGPPVLRKSRWGDHVTRQTATPQTVVTSAHPAAVGTINTVAGITSSTPAPPLAVIERAFVTSNNPARKSIPVNDPPSPVVQPVSSVTLPPPSTVATASSSPTSNTKHALLLELSRLQEMKEKEKKRDKKTSRKKKKEKKERKHKDRNQERDRGSKHSHRSSRSRSRNEKSGTESSSNSDNHSVTRKRSHRRSSGVVDLTEA